MNLISNLKDIYKNGRMDLQTAIETARDKLKGQGQMVAVAGLIVFASFVFIAFIAPFAYRTKGIFSAILSYLPIIFLGLGIYFALQGVFSIGKSEKQNAKTQYKGTLAKTAIDIAIKEAIDAGLVNENATEFTDSISGINNNFPVVGFRSQNMGCFVIRLKKEFNSVLIINSKNALWPIKLPTNRKLTPLIPPDKLPIEAWGLLGDAGRDLAQNLLNELVGVLNMSLMGGEIPFIYAENNSFIIGFRTGDIGTISLIGNETTKALMANYSSK